jgi:hypothetical protein
VKEMKMMKQMKRLILLSMVSLFVVSGLMTVKSLAFNGNESVNGQGKLFNQDGSRSEFSFTARRNPNGNVTGQATLRNPSFKAGNGQNDKIKIDITCLKVIGNVAFLGGTTKRKNNQADAEAVYFAVEDNGSKEADKIFRGFFFDDDETTKGEANLCQSFEPGELPVEPIAEGNIEVKP